MRSITLALMLLMTLFSVLVHAQDAAFTTKRHVYEQGEVCTLRVQAPGAEAVAFDTGGWLPEHMPVTDGYASYTIDSALLRVQAYDVRARVIKAGETIATLHFPFHVAPRHDAERIPVWRWGGGGYNMDWWLQRGFTGGFGGFYRAALDPAKDSQALGMERLLEEAALRDFDMGFYFSTLSATELKENEAIRSLFPDGTRHESKPYPMEPEAVAFTKDVTDSWLKRFHTYPGLRHVMFNSEWQQPYCVNDAAVDMAREDLGIDLKSIVNRPNGLTAYDPTTIKDGIIPDDHPRYRFMQWWWQKGHGTALLNAEQNAIVKQYRPELITWHEPYRLAPVRASHKGLDCIATWTYGFPDIKRLCFTSYLQAAARPENQLVQQDITLFVYGYMSVPLGESTADFSRDFSGRDPYFTAGPDYAREALWLVMSQRPDILCFYSAGALSPTKPTLDPAISSPETYDAIGQVCERLVKPYGPALLAAERVHPRVALLMSAASTWFRVSPRTHGYDNEQTLPYATLLMMNHVPFDVLLDEDIVEGALEQYDLLVMPLADTLTASMHERIVAFAEGGGKIIADASLRAAIPGVQRTAFDFSHQKRISGKALAKGDAVTAEKDRTIMEGHAQALAPMLTDVHGPARADTPRVLTNSLENGDLTWHFFVNDHRGYGPRFGEWKLRFELGLPQRTVAKIAVKEGDVLYDVLRRKQLDYTYDAGYATVDLHLPAARGALIAALPAAIDSLQVTAPSSVNAGEPVTLDIDVLDASGARIQAALPLRIDVKDPLGRVVPIPRYTTTHDGSKQFTFTPAVNDPPGRWTVTIADIVAGKTHKATITCAS